MKSLIKEFKEFAVKGNVFDMAVGVIVGGAFGNIVSSFVNDIVMPLLALIIGDVKFTELKWVLKGSGDTAITMNYGNFIQLIFNFIVTAFAIFLVIKAINKMKRKEEEKPAEPEQPAEPSDEVKALNEIIELLKNK